MPADDESLLLRDLESDRREHAARALFRAYSGELYGFALARLEDRDRAEQVVQDVFMRAWRQARDFDLARGTVRTWLHAMACEALADAQPGLPARDEPIERALLRWQVLAALDRLTPEHREVVRLAHLGGLSVREIATLTGLPEGTVKSRTYYALQNLRLALDEMEAL